MVRRVGAKSKWEDAGIQLSFRDRRKRAIAARAACRDQAGRGPPGYGAAGGAVAAAGVSGASATGGRRNALKSVPSVSGAAGGR